MEENLESNVESVTVAEHAEPTVVTSPGADAANAVGAAHMSAKQKDEAASGSTGGNADDEVHVAELEAALLAASSPDHAADVDADPVETATPSATTVEAEV
jgi:hypothetical protein